MQGLPHDYNATATATVESLVTASIEGQPDLTLAAGSSRDKAERLLEKAEQSCFITNSLKGESLLETELVGGE